MGAIKYPPMGNRSFGLNRGQNYGMDFDSYISKWNEGSTFVVQIETVEGMNNLDEILSSPHVDAAMLGPYDLSGSLGVPGEIDHPKVKEAMKIFIETCKKHGKSCGTHLVDATQEAIEEKWNEGCSFIVCSSDLFMMWKWAEKQKSIYQNIRSGE